ETHSETNSDFLITGTRPLFNDLTVTVNAGGNARVNDFNGTAGIVSRLVIPGVYTLANSDGSPTVGIGVLKKKVNSLYGLASFNFKDWLNVDVTGRNDWSSTLPRNQNSIFYPSVGAAFIVTDALRVQSHLLSYAKVRASWTRVGNDTDPYQLAAVYGSGRSWGGQPTFTALERRAAHCRGQLLGRQRDGRLRPAVRHSGGHQVDARRPGSHRRRLGERAADPRLEAGRARQLQRRLGGGHHEHLHLQEPESVVLVRRADGRQRLLGDEVVRSVLGCAAGD